MGEALQKAAFSAAKISRTDDRETEQMFGSVFSDIARLLYPHKTAAHVAALVGCSERAAEFYLGGQREWSGVAIAAITGEILRRHSIRNVKVTAR